MIGMISGVAGGFVWSGARIAPARKLETSVVLFGLWMLFLGGGVTLALFNVNLGGRQLYFQGGGLAPAMAFVGSLVGLLKVRNELKGTVQE